MSRFGKWKYFALGMLVASAPYSHAQTPATPTSGTEVVESTVLRLELNTSPYSYSVIEKSSREVLVAETGGVTFTTNGYAVRSVTDIAKGPGWIGAKLRLEGTSETVQARFRF